ncbi:MAG: Phosphoserine phosphatase RsbU [Candidatus Anoxychlamydiales bacterium]|nr:Phosphoserine phosphatase RsbU [Candidatus Anoxychlamydiales bacterium]
MEKISKKKPKYFLTHKVFFITLFILILPLFIYDLILYKQEYKLKIDDAYTFLEVLAKSKKTLLDEKLKEIDYLYNLSIQNINFENKKNNCNEEIIDPNLFLKDLSKDFSVKSIFYLSFFDKKLKVKYASDKKLLNLDFTSYRKILNTKNDFFSLNTTLEKNELLYSKTIYSNDIPIGALVFSFNLKPIYFDLDTYQYKINLSVIDFASRIVVTNRKNNNYLYLKPDYHKGLFEREEKNFAIKKQIDNLKYDLVVEIPKSELVKKHIQNYLIKHILLFLLIIFLALLLIYFLVYIFSKPIKSLIEVMIEISNKNFKARYKKKLFGFEINYLGNVFNFMMDTITQKEKEVTYEKEEKEKYLGEIEIARDIQKTLFPKKLPKSKDILIDANFYPAKDVSADFYDIFKIEDKIYFILADACGKGVGACLYSLSIRSMIRSFVQSEKKLEDVIKNVNALFLKDTVDAITFVTAFIGVYDIKKNIFSYTNAGHLPAIYKKNKKLVELQTKPSKAFGIDEIEKVTIESIKLKKDDLIFIYSDGIIDAKNKSNQIFSKKRLEDFILKYDMKNANNFLKDLFQEVDIFTKGEKIYDDMTAIVIKKI